MRIRATNLFVCIIIVLSMPITRAADKAKAEGYAEYTKESAIVVEGQVIRAGSRTKYGTTTPQDLLSCPLGFAVKVSGHRQPDGSILASKVECEEAVRDSLDQQIEEATDEIEQTWVKAGEMYMQSEDGKRQTIGKILDSGPQVTRVRGIMRKLLPPYISEEDVRLRVVETEEWNASAMGNGAIWVYTGLIDDMSDDELAIILGHELTHYSHQHTKRNAEKAQWGQLAALGAAIGLSTVGSSAARDLAGLGAGLSLSAWQSGYSRDLEDQARSLERDVAGLRSQGMDTSSKQSELDGVQDEIELRRHR